MMRNTSKHRKPFVSSPFWRLCAGEGFSLLYQRRRLYRTLTLVWWYSHAELQHNTDYVATAVFTAVLNYKAHIFHTAAVFGAGGNDINSCGVDTAVT